ncbi:hypothetical protein J6590_042856 [Homalodisca vitripennis]|nr:hypothetical protein J6590_042856 [Homalodisca vitripennis]
MAGSVSGVATRCPVHTDITTVNARAGKPTINKTKTAAPDDDECVFVVASLSAGTAEIARASRP